MSQDNLTRADLPLLFPDEFGHLDQDSEGNPCVWRNEYQHQHKDGTFDEWTSEWSCQCDDDGVEPVRSVWIGTQNVGLRALWERLPEAGETVPQPESLDAAQRHQQEQEALIGPEPQPGARVRLHQKLMQAIARDKAPRNISPLISEPQAGMCVAVTADKCDMVGRMLEQMLNGSSAGSADVWRRYSENSAREAIHEVASALIALGNDTDYLYAPADRSAEWREAVAAGNTTLGYDEWCRRG